MIDKASVAAVAEVGRSANSKLDDMIRRNEEFNKQLEAKKATQIEQNNEKAGKAIKLAAIEYLIKCKGMDSQQVKQVMDEITAILGW